MFYYYEKENQIAEAVCYDWETADSQIYANELIIKPTETTYNLFVHAAKFTDIKNTKANDLWRFPIDAKVLIKIHRQPYKRVDYKTKQEKIIDPGLCEKFICEKIESDYNFFTTTKFFGELLLTGGNFIQDYYSEKISDRHKQTIGELIWKLEPLLTGSKTYFADSDFNLIEFKSYNGKKSFSASDRLDSQWEWIACQIEQATDGWKPESLFHVSQLYLNEKFPHDEDRIAAILTTYAHCLQFIHGNS